MIFNRIIDWFFETFYMRGRTFEEIILDDHINKCNYGYIWRGGFLGFSEACEYCNNTVYNLNIMLKNNKYSRSTKLILKEELNKAILEKTNKNKEYN